MGRSMSDTVEKSKTHPLACAGLVNVREVAATVEQSSYEVRSIKPIKWIGNNEPRGTTTAGVAYFVSLDLSELWKASALDGGRKSVSVGEFGTKEEAKAACQADFEQRIYASIEWV